MPESCLSSAPVDGRLPLTNRPICATARGRVPAVQWLPTVGTYWPHALLIMYFINSKMSAGMLMNEFGSSTG
jgi:hypothetical protein